jgi:hypothetical protein
MISYVELFYPILYSQLIVDFRTIIKSQPIVSFRTFEIFHWIDFFFLIGCFWTIF